MKRNTPNENQDLMNSESDIRAGIYRLFILEAPKMHSIYYLTGRKTWRRFSKKALQ